MKHILLLFVIIANSNVNFAAERQPIDNQERDSEVEIAVFIPMGSSITSYAAALDSQTGLHLDLFGAGSLMEKKMNSNNVRVASKECLSQTGFHTNSSGSLVIEIE